ncbi:hypothetical protein A1351_00965 [Methylosinus sp. R-45379]|uniref:hypothetical protein n=1 Tax=unclassified Methylosinus TaxID=2624500 RepID=UPI000464F09A|nr:MULTISPECIES: hypothetical protein [unclassified Methylosinus]OAI29667.1 hypothetical protein A1351_00965 [Methylosinus sp. R-45379]TDX65587.1 hypothetical protein EDE12_10272 [Methylosinus sp. sav-2]
MKPEDRAFLEETARALDASMRELEQEAERLQEVVGDERAQELQAYLRREFEPVDIEEIRRTLDFDDRRLISVWIRIERNRARRVAAGRSAMTLNAGREDIDITVFDKPNKK